MKKIKTLILALFAISFLNAQEKEFSKEVLSQKLLNLDQSSLAFKSILKKHKGKTILIEVWASWCSDCVKAMPRFKEIQTNNPNVDYVFISMDKTAEKWKLGVEKHELKGDHYMAPDGMKGKFGEAINLDWIPRYVVVNKKGKVVLYKAIEKDFDKIESVLNEQK